MSSVEGLRDQRAQLIQLISAQRRDGAATAKPLELRLSRLDYFMSLLEARQQQQQQQQEAQVGRLSTAISSPAFPEGVVQAGMKHDVCPACMVLQYPALAPHRYVAPWLLAFLFAGWVWTHPCPS